MKALVYGCKTSGRGAYKLLNSLGYEVEYINDNSSEDVLDNANLLVLSPAVSINNELVVKAKSRQIEIIGELELAYRHAKGEIIAVTGTNGKTTTCMMLDNVLRENNISHYLLGNVGKSYANNALRIKDDDKVILEVSSYQLESIEKFKPHIGVFLNISQDHIERHLSFDEYLRCKEDMFSNMDSNDIAILNFDDKVIIDNQDKIMAKKYYVSLKERVYGTYVSERFVYFLDEKLFSVKDMHLTGEHNIANALPVILIGKLYGISNYNILRAIRSFNIPPHRIQFIGKYKGKNYYNDSKATNIDATISAMNTMKKSTTLIVGGYDKGISYHRLFECMPKCIKSVVIFGQNRKRVEDTIKDYDIRYYVVDSLLKAITKASKERVENVLFSPATSSYDMFTNYEERGDMFIKLVGDINED